MEQPEHWSNGSRIALVCDRPALLASLRAEGFDPGEVITLAKFLAREAIEKELQNHGFTIAHIESAHVKAVAEAVFAAQSDALIAEAKARLIDYPNKLSRRSKAVGGTER
jgi:endonuclease/exonuclease/phosphatase family metal-dependent hydrolase